MATDDDFDLLAAYREVTADWLAHTLADARAHGWRLQLAPWHAEQMLVDEHITLRGISPDVDGRYRIVGRRPRGHDLELDVRREEPIDRVWMSFRVE